MPPEHFDTLLQFFKVLGNESRLKILGLLAQEERTVGELATILGVKEPTISHHLSLMKQLELVEVKAVGNERIHRLNPSALENMNRDIFSQSNLATLVDDTSENAWEQKVLKTFIEGSWIKELPAKHKKRRVILKWVANQFEMGVQYPETEMNARLKQYHSDHAALRRYLIENRLMQREQGIYWRIDASVDEN